MSDVKLNKKFDIPIGELEERINYSLNGDLNGYDHACFYNRVFSGTH